jgi:hypothetical protein
VSRPIQAPRPEWHGANARGNRRARPSLP